MKRKNIVRAIVIGAAAVGAAGAALSEYAYKKAFYCKPRKEGSDPDYYMLTGEQYDKYRELNIEQVARLKARPFKEVWITSFDGLKLYGR